MATFFEVAWAAEKLAIVFVIFAALPALDDVIVFFPVTLAAFFADAARALMNLFLHAPRKLAALVA